MSKSPRSAAADQSRERVVFIDILKQQMLDLKVLRKVVAETASAAKKKRKNGRPLSTPTTRCSPKPSAA
jgi:hypothetical protein